MIWVPHSCRKDGMIFTHPCYHLFLHVFIKFVKLISQLAYNINLCDCQFDVHCNSLNVNFPYYEHIGRMSKRQFSLQDQTAKCDTIICRHISLTVTLNEVTQSNRVVHLVLNKSEQQQQNPIGLHTLTLRLYSPTHLAFILR